MAARSKVARPGARAAHPAGEAGVKSAFAHDWKRRVRKLEKLAAITPDKLSNDDVHDMRVTTRRLRASISVLRRCVDSKPGGAARRDLRVLGRALGKRRMLDIAMHDARTYRADTARLESRHSRAQSALAKVLRKKQIDLLAIRLANIDDEIARAPFERLSWWLQDFEWELAYLIEQRPRTAEARHELRIELKKVRYVLEALGRRTPKLEKLQDYLGREHDLATLQTFIGTNRRVARDERKARTQADRAMAPALNAALKNLQAVRRELGR